MDLMQHRTAAQRLEAPVVLVAEDEGAVRCLIRRMLEAEGYQVLEALDAQDAITVARSSQHPIDVLVTDVVMPGLDGIGLAECLAREGLVSRVVVCSGYAGGRIGIQLEGVARWAFLAKPFGRLDLCAAMRKVLGQEPPSGPEEGPE